MGEYHVKSMESKKSHNQLYIFLLVLVILNSSHTYAMQLWMPGTWQAIIGILAFISCKVSYKNLKKIPKEAIIVYLVMSISGFLGFGVSITALSKFAAFLPVITFFMLSKDDLHCIIEKLNKIFTVLLLLSLSLYFLNIAGVNIPSSGLVSFNDQYYLFNHLYLYVELPMYGGAFTGFSLEPGYFSLFLVCMLLVNEFDFQKKSVWLYVVCILLSMSLEGYLLLFIGYILQRAIKQGSLLNALKIATVIICVLTILVIVAFTYNNGNNVIVEEILSRLAFDEELGIVGNNRESAVAKDVIDRFFYSNEVWKGVGYQVFRTEADKVGFDAASARIFIVVYGAIYTIFFFVLSLFLLKKTHIKYTLPFFIVYWLDFIPHGDLFAVPMYLLLIYMNIYFVEPHVIESKVKRIIISQQTI